MLGGNICYEGNPCAVAGWWLTHLHGTFASQCNLIHTTFVLLWLVSFTIEYYLLSFCSHLDFQPLSRDMIQESSQEICDRKSNKFTNHELVILAFTNCELQVVENKFKTV